MAKRDKHHWDSDDDPNKEEENLRKSHRQRRRASEFVAPQQKKVTDRKCNFMLPFAVVILAIIIAVYIGYMQNLINTDTNSIQSSQKSHEPVTSTGNEGAKSDANKLDLDNPHFKYLLTTSTRYIDKICRPDGQKDCYIVSDYYNLGVDGKFYAYRRLSMASAKNLILSSVALRPPREIDENTRNSAIWLFNKKEIEFPYAQLHLGLPFVTESLAFKPNRQQNVLIIGMAGGSTSSFYSEYAEDMNLSITVVELDPLMKEIGEKHFGHKESDRMKVLLEDGAVFAKEARGKGLSYDTIILDACSPFVDSIACPAPIFREQTTIQDISAILSDDGLLSINILIMNDSIQDGHYDEILRRFENHFASCYLLPYKTSSMNSVGNAKKLLLCSHRENWTWQTQKEKFLKKIKTVDKKLKFSLEKVIDDL